MGLLLTIIIIASEEIDTVTPMETKWDYCPVASTDHLVRLLLHQIIAVILLNIMIMTMTMIMIMILILIMIINIIIIIIIFSCHEIRL